MCASWWWNLLLRAFPVLRTHFCFAWLLQAVNVILSLNYKLLIVWFECMNMHSSQYKEEMCTAVCTNGNSIPAGTCRTLIWFHFVVFVQVEAGSFSQWTSCRHESARRSADTSKNHQYDSQISHSRNLLHQRLKFPQKTVTKLSSLSLLLWFSQQHNSLYFLDTFRRPQQVEGRIKSYIYFFGITADAHSNQYVRSNCSLMVMQST